MTERWDPLLERERLGRPLAGALFMHAALASMAFAYSWLAARNILRFGDPNALPGGAVPINVVKSIPLAPAQSVIDNPVANDSRFSIPTPPQAQPQPQTKAAEPDPAAIPLPGPQAKKPRRELRAAERLFRPYVPERDNQLYSIRGMGVNTPSYTGLASDSFGVGVGAGTGTPFGSRYGWYVETLQRRLGEQWQRELLQVDPRIRIAPRTVVSFEILRDGSLRGIKVTQPSGSPAIDYAAQRAVQNANPVAPLPTDLGKSSVTTEVWFQLKR